MGVVQQTIWAAVKAGDRLTTNDWAHRLGLPWGVALDTLNEMAKSRDTPVIIVGNLVTLASIPQPPLGAHTKTLRLTKTVTTTKNLTIQVSLNDEQLKQLFQSDWDDSNAEAFTQVAWCIEDSVDETEWHTVKSRTDFDTEIVEDQYITPDVIAHDADVACAVDMLVEPDPM